MIVFDLKCPEGCAAFEAWFSSSSDFADQTERGFLRCPYCGSTNIEKAPMAPRVSRSDGMPAETTDAIVALASLQAKLLEKSEWVGGDLSETARAMHLGEIEQRPVHGHASADEARSLIDDGISILPLPLPVVPPGQVN